MICDENSESRNTLSTHLWSIRNFIDQDEGLVDDELIVWCYQGPLACQILEKNKGVCWAAIQQQKTIIVPDVEQFPGHIACDSRSRSEIAVPLKDAGGNIKGVLDIDSQLIDNFNETDAKWLEKIIDMVYG